MIKKRIANWNDVPDIYNLFAEDHEGVIDKSSFEDVMRRLLYHPRYQNVVYKENLRLIAFLSIEKDHILNLFQIEDRVISEIFSKDMNIEKKEEIKKMFF